MSATQERPQTECTACEEDYRTGYNGAYCSETCFYRAKGETALKNLQTDHTVCGTCATKLKTTEGPSEDWKHSHGSHYEVVLQRGGELIQTPDGISLDASELPDIRPTDTESIIGHEYHTENATQGVDEKEAVFHNIQYERVSCGNCGSVNPNDEPHEFLREIDTAKLLVRVLKRMREKFRENRVPEKISKTQFFEAYKESDGDLAYAVGKGIYSE
jgi:hypothetical protein